MKKIVRDEFTERLLAIRLELVKRDALEKKKDFSEALEITSVFWNHIEAQRNNYPMDDDKRGRAAKNLLQIFNVNMNYLLGNDKKMFVAEPPKKKKAVGERVATVDFRDKKQKQVVMAEIESKDNRIKELEALLSQCHNRLSKYETV